MFLNQPIPPTTLCICLIVAPWFADTSCWFVIFTEWIPTVTMGAIKLYKSHRMCTFILRAGCLFSFTWSYSSLRFRLCLCTICWFILFIYLFCFDEELRSKRSHSAFSSFLSSTTWADLYYITALLRTAGTSAWTRAQECWPSGRTLRQAATGWGSACLTGCGRMWSRASEFTSGIWKKRPSCHLPHCVWQVTSGATDSADDSILQHFYLGVLTWPPNNIQEKVIWDLTELSLFHCVHFPLTIQTAVVIASNLPLMFYWTQYHIAHAKMIDWLYFFNICSHLLHFHWKWNSFIFYLNPWKFACQVYYAFVSRSYKGQFWKCQVKSLTFKKPFRGQSQMFL